MKQIHDIDGLHKRLMQTWFDFDQDIIDPVIDQWRNRASDSSLMLDYMCAL